VVEAFVDAVRSNYVGSFPLHWLPVRGSLTEMTTIAVLCYKAVTIQQPLLSL